jgi:hypothetical protein
MKQKFGIAMIVGALLGVGISAQGVAAPAKKESHAASKKAAPAASKSSPKMAAKSGSKSSSKKVVAAHSGKSHKVAHAPAHKGGKHMTVAAVHKPMRKVSYNEVDPDRLALYSASALVSLCSTRIRMKWCRLLRSPS